MVERDVTYYSRGFPWELKDLIRICLSFIRYSMGHTLVTFRGEFFEYGINEDIDSKGLTIGGYESAWLADLVAGFVLELNRRAFVNCVFDGIYRDDGLMVMRGKRSQEEVLLWLDRFQRRVDATLGSDRLQFTATM